LRCARISARITIADNPVIGQDPKRFFDALGGSLWAIQSDRDRGFLAEELLGGRTGLPDNFPTIDRFENGVATSVKTMDLRATSYQSAQGIKSRAETYIDKVSAFAARGNEEYGGVVVRKVDVKGRALDLVVPPDATQTQLQALQNLIAYGKQKTPPVTVTIVVIP
jgi:hypothetical protein